MTAKNHRRQQGKRDKYRKLSHAQRIMIIYLRIIHHMPLDFIQERSNVKYNTIRNILRAYRKYGRTNKEGIDGANA